MKAAELFALKGRAGRGEYWRLAIGVPLLTGAVIVFALGMADGRLEEAGEGTVLAVLAAVGAVWLAATALGLAASVRRMHDLDRSGWWVLLSLVPVANIGMFIWQGFYEGTRGPNAHGAEPKPPTETGSTTRWLLVGQGGQYADCEFPLERPLVFGTDARHASVVIDARRYPDVEPAHCQLRPPTASEPASLWWPDAANRFERRDATFDGRQLDLGSGLRFAVEAAETTAGTT